MKLLLIPVAILILASCNNKKKTTTDSGEPAADTSATTTTVEKDQPPVAAETTASSIVGKWKPVEANMKDMDEEEKKEFLNDASIEFTAAGKYIALSKEDNETGTYSYDENTKMLTTTSPDGTAEKIKAVISNDKLTVYNEDGTMVFKRTN